VSLKLHAASAQLDAKQRANRDNDALIECITALVEQMLARVTGMRIGQNFVPFQLINAQLANKSEEAISL
jgi:hypothetical protein